MRNQKVKKRLTARKNAVRTITITEKVRWEGDYSWTTFVVQGWKENGRWQRRQFKERRDAEVFAADKRVALENSGRAQKLMLCPLSQRQLDEAVRAVEGLGSTYSLTEAVAFFLKHHRAPEFTIAVSDAVRYYLDDRERDGLRPRTLKGLKSVLNAFAKQSHDPQVHEVTTETVERFLRDLRAKDGTNKATWKTWNNYRNDLHRFFSWCGEADKTTERPWTFEDPVGPVRKFSARQVREEQPAMPATTSHGDLQRILTLLMRWRGGVMLRYYCYLYFTGIRPVELSRLSDREAELANLKTGIIMVPADISKTRHPRQVTIPPNLRKWLEVAPGPIIPKNFDRLAKLVRAHFKLSHDEARHSFISYHVALHRSLGDAALQAGNSETIVRRHYLNLHPQEEGKSFFSLVPDLNRRRAVIDTDCSPEPKPLMKAV